MCIHIQDSLTNFHIRISFDVIIQPTFAIGGHKFLQTTNSSILLMHHKSQCHRLIYALTLVLNYGLNMLDYV